MSIEFDPAVINEFAGRLYTKARSLAFGYALLVGFASAVALAAAARAAEASVIGFVIGAVVGYVWGREKAFQYRLQAQTALCQLKIATNTTKTAT